MSLAAVMILKVVASLVTAQIKTRMAMLKVHLLFLLVCQANLCIFMCTYILQFSSYFGGKTGIL